MLTDRRADGLTGLSGLKTVGLLQRLVRLFNRDPLACYVEIGVYQALTLVSTALEAAPMPCFGIDNFATLDPQEKNLSVVRERLESFSVSNARLINSDFEQALESLDEHIGDRKAAVYFIDGPHDYRSQLVCLLAAKKHLHDHAVIVIDDANYPDVRRATYDFLISHSEFKMIFEAYSPGHPANMEPADRAEWEDGWLNGVNVLVRDPEGLIPEMLPPVSENRTPYFNEWLVNRLRMAELAPEALILADAIVLENSEAELEARENLIAAYQVNKESLNGRLADRNLYSEGLTTGRMNSLHGQT